MSWLEEYGRPTARKVAAAFGGTPRFKRHLDEAEQNSIDMLSCDDRPSEGLVSYSTLGFAAPLEWEELSSVDLGGDVVVRWLLVIPISDSELRWKLDKGWDELENLFVEKGIDYWDLNRSSVV